MSGNAVTRQLPTEGIWLQVKPGRWRHRGTELQRAQDGGTSDDRDSRITPMPLLLFEREFTSRSPAELNRESDFFNPSVFWVRRTSHKEWPDGVSDRCKLRRGRLPTTGYITILH